MERIDDTIKLESRSEIHELISALEAIPEDAQNEATKELITHLEHMDMVW